MDLDQLKSVVKNELSTSNDLYSLKIQNHIYGCFILMEDIAQNVMDVSGTIISNPKFTFDFDKQFSEIGIRYGFAMDTKLTLESFNESYKSTWLGIFNDVDLSKDINEVDRIEDALIEIIQKSVKLDIAFFINALDTGSLPQEWIAKVLLLINPPPINISSEKDVEIVKTALTKAISEKPLARKRLSTTRRANIKTISSSKKSLAKTRRHL